MQSKVRAGQLQSLQLNFAAAEINKRTVEWEAKVVS